MTLPLRPGFHGKLPSRGDFVAWGMNGAFFAAWDLWLSRGLEATYRHHGRDWEGLLDDSPTWRFVLPAGLWSDRAAAGVMTPSRDRVARRFPFALICELPDGLAPAAAPARCRGWFDRAERAARRLVAWGAEPDFATEAAMALGAPETDAGPDGDCIAQALGPLADDVSLWWCRGSGRVAPSLAAAPGAPSPDQFVALLDGGWAARGWRDLDAAA